MASEIRVNKLNSQTGVGTISLSPTGVDISGITTAETLKATTGIVTTLTATTGIVTALTTNTLTANSTAKVGSGVTLSPDGDVFVTGVTTSTTVQVGSATTIHTTGIDLGNGNLTGHNLHSTGITTSSSVIVGGGVTISESGIEASGIGITCANINEAQIGGRRNLVINGAMQVAQRGTSSDVSSTAYGSVDRFQLEVAGLDNAVTMAQVDVSSGTTPYTEGFRKALKLTNGDQTSVGNTDTMRILYKFEGQDIAQSGWNHKSASSFITLSFWVKSSVAQSFKVSLISWDGGAIRTFVFDTGSLSANTWTKVTKTIPGDSTITVDNDVNNGFQISFYQYLGTNYTQASGYTENAWGAYQNPQTPAQTSTWYDTNDATYELTGVQLEVGSQATPFEHRSAGEERLLCQRYYIKYVQQGCSGYIESVAGTTAQLTHNIPVPMRANPSTVCTTASSIGVERGGLYGINSTSGTLGWIYETDLNIGWSMDTAKTRWHTTWCRVQNLELDAEL